MKNNPLSKKTQVILIIAMLCVILYTCYTLSIVVEGYAMILNRTTNRGNDDNILAMIKEVDYLYSQSYIGESPDNSELEDGILSGLVQSYDDPYAVYRSPEETEKFKNTQDEMLIGGIGTLGHFENNMEKFSDYKYSMYISHIYDESPAEEAGLQAGDRIVQANDIQLTLHNYDEFRKEISGEVGTKVTLKILRGEYNEETGEDYRYLTDIEVTRGVIKNNSIFYEILDGNIGYIKINTFSNESDEEFEASIQELQNQGIDKYILDVRNNSGGSADTVVRMLDMLLPEGLIVSIDSKNDEDDIDYYSDASEIPGKFICLINENSVSASELFALALKDYGKATLVGATTYGKGTVVSTFTLSNGGSITLSTGKYVSKSGVDIEDKGVDPDIEVDIPDSIENYLYKLPKSEDAQLTKAISVLQGE